MAKLYQERIRFLRNSTPSLDIQELAPSLGRPRSSAPESLSLVWGRQNRTTSSRLRRHPRGKQQQQRRNGWQRRHLVPPLLPLLRSPAHPVFYTLLVPLVFLLMMMTMPVTSAPVSSLGRVALAKEKLSISQGSGASSSSASATNLQLVRGAGSILFNNSMMEEQPQGDQPGPPFNTEGLPKVPPNWKQSTQRELYLHNREGLFLAMLPDGRTRGVQNASESAFSKFKSFHLTLLSCLWYFSVENLL